MPKTSPERLAAALRANLRRRKNSRQPDSADPEAGDAPAGNLENPVKTPAAASEKARKQPGPKG